MNGDVWRIKGTHFTGIEVGSDEENIYWAELKSNWPFPSPYQKIKRELLEVQEKLYDFFVEDSISNDRRK